METRYYKFKTNPEAKMHMKMYELWAKLATHLKAVLTVKWSSYV